MKLGRLQILWTFIVMVVGITGFVLTVDRDEWWAEALQHASGFAGFAAFLGLVIIGVLGLLRVLRGTAKGLAWVAGTAVGRPEERSAETLAPHLVRPATPPREGADRSDRITAAVSPVAGHGFRVLVLTDRHLCMRRISRREALPGVIRQQFLFVPRGIARTMLHAAVGGGASSLLADPRTTALSWNGIQRASLSVRRGRVKLELHAGAETYRLKFKPADPATEVLGEPLAQIRFRLAGRLAEG